MATLEDIQEFAEEVALESTAAETAVILTLLDLTQNRQELATRFSKFIAEKRKKERDEKK